MNTKKGISVLINPNSRLVLFHLIYRLLDGFYDVNLPGVMAGEAERCQSMLARISA
jgi:hypothetical protein